jgi:hypothetical protein
VQRNFLQFSATVILFFLIANLGCTKIDSTTLGSDLIPAVDNVNTFDTILAIDGTQGLFDDSTRTARADAHLIGSISNDPVFGKTTADIFLELKPQFFPFAFGNKNDTINDALAAGTGFDSVVLCLAVKSFYGDSTKPQHFKVYQINNGTTNFKDSAYKLNYQPDADYQPDLLGELTILPTQLRDTITLKTTKKEKFINQLRIKLSTAFLGKLLENLDTSSAGAGKKVYRSDSLFRDVFKGFAVVSDDAFAGNGLWKYITAGKTIIKLILHFQCLHFPLAAHQHL